MTPLRSSCPVGQQIKIILKEHAHVFICCFLQKKFCWPTLAYASQKSFYELMHTACDIQTFPLYENTEGTSLQPVYTAQLEKSTGFAVLLDGQLAARAEPDAPHHSLL